MPVQNQPAPPIEPSPQPLSGTQQPVDRYYNLKGLIGCLGGFFQQLIVSSMYQWGIINVYVTSYYRLSDPSVSLENNGVLFPVMMACIGFSMPLGPIISKKIGTFWCLILAQITASALAFASSYSPNFAVFVLLFGMLFGLAVGTTLLIPLIECNLYFPGKRMYVNGFLLIAIGLGSVIFGQFSSNYLNPYKVPSNKGYYDGTLSHIAQGVPSCVRWLSLIYLFLGIVSALLLLPVLRKNERVAKAQSVDALQPKVAPNTCPNAWAGIKTPVFWALALIVVFGICGNLLVNGNYKTYVKSVINDDQYLTLVGSIGSIGNGCSRFLWNMYFNQVGFRPTIMTFMIINIILLICVRWTTLNPSLYCFMVFMFNSILGGVLVVIPTKSMMVFGQIVGSNLYSVYWTCIAIANFIQYAFVSQLSARIGFDNLYWICLGMCAVVVVLVIFHGFEYEWPVAVQKDQTAAKNPDHNASVAALVDTINPNAKSGAAA